MVRIHLSLESKPPWQDRQSEIFAFFVSLDWRVQTWLGLLTSATGSWLSSPRGSSLAALS